MAIIQKSLPSKPVIDLTGPQGNIFSLIGFALRTARTLGLDAKEIKEDMMSSDYEHAVQVFDNHFGFYIDLAR